MKIIFISGPFRGKTHWDVVRNIRRAEEIALKVAEFGAMPLCPQNNTRNFDGLLTDEFWLEGTLELLRRCDAVLMTGDWKNSSGSLGEEEEAKRIGMPIFYSINHLRHWVEEQNEKVQEESKESTTS